MKLLLKIIVGLLVLIIIVAVVAWVWIDSIAKIAVVEGTQVALGVDTSLDSVSISLLNGTITMKEFIPSNPKGFDKSPHLLRLGKLHLAVDTGTVLSNPIRAKKFELDGLDLHIEMNLDTTSNISTVLDYASGKNKADGDSSSDDPAPAKGRDDSASEKSEDDAIRILVKEIVVRNVIAYFYTAISPSPVKIPIPEITIDNFSSDEGIPVNQIVLRILPAVIIAVVKEAGQQGGALPPFVLENLNGSVKDFAGLMGGDTQKTLQSFQKNIGVKVIDELIEKSPLKDIKGIENIKNLIPGIGGDKDENNNDDDKDADENKNDDSENDGDEENKDDDDGKIKINAEDILKTIPSLFGSDDK